MHYLANIFILGQCSTIKHTCRQVHPWNVLSSPTVRRWMCFWSSCIFLQPLTSICNMNMLYVADIVILELCSTVKHTYSQVNPWNVVFFFFNPRQGPGATLRMLEVATQSSASGLLCDLRSATWFSKRGRNKMLDKSVAVPKLYATLICTRNFKAVLI